MGQQVNWFHPFNVVVVVVDDGLCTSPAVRVYCAHTQDMDMF
jgi:hypothetical protein